MARDRCRVVVVSIPLAGRVTCCQWCSTHMSRNPRCLRTCTVSHAPSRQLTANTMRWRVVGGGIKAVRSFLHTTVSYAPSRQLTADSMGRWRVADVGCRAVRSFLHTGHETDTDEDDGLWHQRKLALVVDAWRKRNNGTEPSAERLQQMSSMLEDLTRMHSAQNGGALPTDADVRTWFEISASKDVTSASSGNCSADATAEELKLPHEKLPPASAGSGMPSRLKLPHEFSPSEWQAELARRRGSTAAAASDRQMTVAHQDGAGTAFVYTKLLVMALYQAMQQMWNVARQAAKAVSAQQHTLAQFADDSDEGSHADATTAEWPAFWEVESATPDMHHAFLRIRFIDTALPNQHQSAKPVGYISKSAQLEQLRTRIVCSWVDGHIQDPMLDIKFAHDYAGGASSEEQLELLDKSTDSGAALLCKQDPDAPGSHSCGRDGFSLGSLRIIVRGQVTPVFISDDLLQSSSFVSWAAIRNIRNTQDLRKLGRDIRNNQDLRKLGRDAIGTGKGMLLL
eukprot:COSAG02_NODE_4855_length_4899_cov_2.679167_1_plen_510_part_10